MTPPHVQRKSADDPPIPYETLDTPCQLDLPVIEYAREGVGDGFVVHHLYVPCSRIHDLLLPLDANPREPARVGGQVERMQDTLINHPKDFVKLNNGITMICDGISREAGVCSITFGEGQGVCNGGHTYFSIVTNPTPLSDDALVHLELIEFPPGLPADQRRQVASEIAQARNNNAQLRLRSQADFLSYYDWYKEFMTNSHFVSWHENDSEAVRGHIDAELYLRFLTALDTDQYYHPIWHPNANDRHRTPVQSSSGPHAAWFHKMDEHVRNNEPGLPPLGELAALANDVFELRDRISQSLREVANGGAALGQFRKWALYQDQMGETRKTKGGIATKLRPLLTDPLKEGCDLAATLEVLLIGLFRTNIWLFYGTKESVQLVGWYKEPLHLWDERAAGVLTAIAGDYKDQGNDMIAFIRVKSPYTNDLFTMVGHEPPKDPDVVYDAWKGHKYVKEPERAAATHYLLDGDAGGMFPLSSETPPTPGSFLYRKVKDGTVRDMWTQKD